MNTIDQLRAEIRDIEIEKKNAFFENNRIQRDLYSVTQEVFHLRHVLETSQAECEELKAQLKFYCIEVQRIGEDLRNKETERTDLVKHLKFLGQEASALGNNRECLSEELNCCKLKLTESEKEIMRLEACIEEKECTIKSLDGKLQELACLSSQLEQQLECLQQEKYCQGQELVSCRETLQELVMQKEALCHQLKTCESCKAKLEEELKERKGIINILQEELAKERHNSCDLEDLLRKTKIELNDVCLCNQRYKEEILGLGEKIEFLCDKLNAEKQENEDYHLDIETLRKQIMTARHEKSYFMKEDLKFTQRHSVAVPPGGNQARTPALSKLKTMTTENIISSKNRYPDYSAMCVKPSSRRPSVPYLTLYQKREESANKLYNDNIKDADMRYQLYLENLTKIQSYTHTYNNQRKNKNNRQCKQFNLSKNRKHLEEDLFRGGYDQSRDCDGFYSRKTKNIPNENVETLQELKRDEENKNDSRKIENEHFETESKNLKKNIPEPSSNGVIEKKVNAKANSQHTSSEFESLKPTTGEKVLKETTETKKLDKDENNLVPENSQHSQTPTSNNKNEADGTSPNAKDQKTNIKAPVITTVQQAFVNNTTPARVMFQQTYSLKSRPDSIKQIDEITNDGHRKLQIKLNRLKSLGDDGDATTTSSEMGSQDVGGSINNNMYVDIVNRLHEKVNKKKKFCKK